MRKFLFVALLAILLSGCKSTRPRQEQPPRQEPPSTVVPARADLKT